MLEFGATGVFWDGLMFGVVSEDMLYFRFDDHKRTAFKEAASFFAPQLREEGPHHRPLFLACTRAAV